MKPGDYFIVDDGVIRIPGGGSVCMWALHSLLPILVDLENRDEDRVQVEYAQCPDPDGRVIFKIGMEMETEIETEIERGSLEGCEDGAGSALQDLKVVVDEAGRKCGAGMRPGEYFVLRRGRLHIPAQGRFCLYALQAVLPLLPAKQRELKGGDWLKDAARVACPDPAGNVIMRIEPYP
jgi:uncharacterized repeat protein (TIGR04076 family)